jgi:hypothetical protein
LVLGVQCSGQLIDIIIRFRPTRQNREQICPTILQGAAQFRAQDIVEVARARILFAANKRVETRGHIAQKSMLCFDEVDWAVC